MQRFFSLRVKLRSCSDAASRTRSASSNSDRSLSVNSLRHSAGGLVMAFILHAIPAPRNAVNPFLVYIYLKNTPFFGLHTVLVSDTNVLTKRKQGPRT